MPASLKAILFDAGNTLLFLDHDRMAAAVGAELGVPLSGARLAGAADVAARAAERAAGPDRDRSRIFLEALFGEAGVPAERMPEVAGCLQRLHAECHLWGKVVPGTREALDRLRARGLRLGVISNSDGRVEEALVAAGLRDCFEVVLDSALAGVEKPDPAIFRAALAALGVRPEEALYVGDLYEVDVVGARAAGMEAVLLLPEAAAPGPDCRRYASLAALADDLLNGGRR
jgi:putative hydrolase of the HAD superfamily